MAVIGAFAVFVDDRGRGPGGPDGRRVLPPPVRGRLPAGWPDPAAHTVRYLWSATFAFPVQVVLILGLTRVLGGPVPRGRGWARNVVAGYLTWLLVTPAAFVVFVLANIVHARLTGRPPDKHPLTMLGDGAGSREWALFALQTILLAPALEELVFRGLLLPWLAQRRPPPAPEAAADHPAGPPTAHGPDPGGRGGRRPPGRGRARSPGRPATTTRPPPT